MDPKLLGKLHQEELPEAEAKEAILEGLLQLRNDYRALESYIKFIYDSVPEGGFWTKEGWIAVKDRDEAGLRSVSPLWNMAGLRWDMRKLLRYAKSYGLATELVAEVQEISRRVNR